MTVTEAERALNAKLGPMEPPYTSECYVVSRADGKDEALSYVIVDGRIAVISLFLDDGRRPDPKIVDANGIGVGSTETDIERAYGATERTFAPYESEETAEEMADRLKHGVTETPPPPNHWVIAKNQDATRAIIFETRDRKVIYWRTGLLPAVMSWEDCI
ncbi:MULTISPECIES: hypothetical protein [unclassified Bradyrhizobium]|uniref:hypothetical protein n=1 Tax=unclassified Bradyrhizobium TaxID=2631580 RepID=UPI0024E15EC3|nr:MULTISPECIES: hypothetical protein [unclassified Bradyrhizobium]